MPAQPDLSKLSVTQFAERFRGEMIPLSNTFSYFCASVPMSEEDLKEYLEEPVAALPPTIARALPKISILLVPYLERGDGHEKRKTAPPAADYVSIERPPEGRLSPYTQLKLGDETVLAFALKDQEVAEYHYRFYHLLATLMADHWSDDVENRYIRVLRDELSADVHGEVDEPSWRLKQAMRRSQNVRNGKAFREYARQSFADTLTLYLHGICCDIDVDTGPRQLPSRYLRKRLLLLEECSRRRRVTRCSPNSSKRIKSRFIRVDREIPDLRIQFALRILDKRVFAWLQRLLRPDPEQQIGFLLLEGFDLVELLLHHAVIFQLQDGYIFRHAPVLFRRQPDDVDAFIIGKPEVKFRANIGEVQRRMLAIQFHGGLAGHRGNRRQHPQDGALFVADDLRFRLLHRLDRFAANVVGAGLGWDAGDLLLRQLLGRAFFGFGLGVGGDLGCAVR